MRKRDDLTGFCDLAVDLGAADAKVIETDKVVVRNWVRWKCHFGCNTYGRSLMCPPHTPTPEETRSLIREYEYALLVRFKSSTPKSHIQNQTVELERHLFLEGYYSALAFTSGSCHLCDECNLEEGYCVKPRTARPSMESCGISVFETAKEAGYQIETLRSKSEKYFRYSLILLC